MIIGLGLSVGGIVTAEAIIITNFDDLDSKASQIPGKLVVYAVDWVNYDSTEEYRVLGASRTGNYNNFLHKNISNNIAKYGAIAVLVRSVTPFSIESPHTGI